MGSRVRASGTLPGLWIQSPDEVTPANAPTSGSGALHLIEVPDPLSGENPVYRSSGVPVPAAGGSVADADFGTTQTRVIQTEGIRHEYSRHDPFNADRTMILLQDISRGEWRVYRTRSVPYDAQANLVRGARPRGAAVGSEPTKGALGVTRLSNRDARGRDRRHRHGQGLRPGPAVTPTLGAEPRSLPHHDEGRRRVVERQALLGLSHPGQRATTIARGTSLTWDRKQIACSACAASRQPERHRLGRHVAGKGTGC